MANTMMTYILETPKRIDYVNSNSKKGTAKLVNLFLEKDYRRIWLVGCGSSYNGAVFSKAFIEKYLDVDVIVIQSSEFMYTKNRVKDDDFVLFFSQSGCSTNTIEAIDEFKKSGHKAIGITGSLKGDLKSHADYVVDWMCGEETVGFVTKGLTILTLFLMQFSKEAAYKKKLINEKTYKSLNDDFASCSKAFKEISDNTIKLVDNNPKEFGSITSMYSIGFGQGFAVAHEGALKLAETIKKPSMLYEAEEYAHGPNNTLTPSSTCFFVDDPYAGSKRLLTLYKATREVTDRAFILTNSKAVDDKHAVRYKTKIKEGLLLPIYALAFYQTIAYVATDNYYGWKEHKLVANFKKIAATKTESLSKVMPDYEIKK